MWRLALAVFIACCVTQAIAAGDGPWQLKRSRDGIKVYTRTVAGSKFRAVKATATIHTRLSSIVAMVRDTRACPHWQAMCAEARALKVISPTDVYVYQVTHLPWPASDRDVTAHVLWHQNPVTLTVTMTAHAVDGLMAPQPHRVRVTQATTYWRFQPAGHGMVNVTTEAHIDPGGPLPAWIVNMLIVNSPFKTMSNIRRLLASGRFKNAHLDFIKEPKIRGASD